jgi:hypothetical protein
MKKYDINNTDYTRPFAKQFSHAEQHHFGSIEQLTRILKDRLAEKRFGNFGIRHAATTEAGKTFVVIPGIAGEIIFTEDGYLGTTGAYALNESPVAIERVRNALVKLFVGGYPMQLMLDIIDHLSLDQAMPSDTVAERFMHIVENFKEAS